ncbi:transcription termination factor Rho [Corynebacterium sp. H78]|uniref:transcription termination factor Rho n=1 Tax=Corynebacterium sp. H78 TaxID=3133417 RepID=UPI00309F0BA8
MTDTDTTASEHNGQENLTALRMPELRAIAVQKGIRGVSAMRKHELIAAIQGAPSGGADAPRGGRRKATRSAGTPEESVAPAKDDKPAQVADDSKSVDSKSDDNNAGAAESGNESKNDSKNDDQLSRSQQRRQRRNRQRQRDTDQHDDDQQGSATRGDDQRGNEERGGEERANDQRGDSHEGENRQGDHDDSRDNASASENNDDSSQQNENRRERGGRNNRGRNRNDRGERNDRGHNDRGHNDRGERGNNDRNDRNDDSDDDNRNRRGRNNNNRNNRGDRNDDDNRRGGRNRRNRRDRRGRDGNRSGQDEIREDDVLQPVAGIVDVLENGSAFVRTTGYLPGSTDVHVSQQIVRKFGLRKGDYITGQVRMPRENGAGQVTHGNGRNKRKYNPLVKVDMVNGLEPEKAAERPKFSKLTPLYPNRRLRLETEQNILTTRVIDLIMPIGKGQRALIVSPPKAGKTTILQNIANAIATNNPECYLMVVLVDERPEEVTDMQRSVRGEVISSTFDRPPSDHTTVAELAIERAKRLVEQGQDVVVLLDSITRLGRAYNNSSPASGRILSGGVDSNALYPPKRFLGAARNIEEGGSLTIIATAMVETGSAGDTVIFEEFKGTGNAELKLDRKISERRVFPAVDVNPSGTRKDELLLAPEEARILHKLRRILSALDPQAAIDLLIKQLKKTKNNYEFLTQVASSAPMAADVDVDDML